MTGQPDPKKGTHGGIGRKKPARKASASRIAEIRAKKATVCRLCGTTENVNAHHLVPRQMGGTTDDGGLWTESNIVGLCGLGNTSGCHGLIESRNRAACHLLRTLLTDAEYSYVATKRGEAWLDLRYPAVWEAA